MPPWTPNSSRFTIPCELDLPAVLDGIEANRRRWFSMILKWMFPGGKSLPHVVVSHNARFDPVRHFPSLASSPWQS